MNTRELKSQRAALLDDARAIVATAEAEKRELTDAERTDFDGKMSKVDALAGDIQRAEKLNAMIEERKAPAVLQYGTGEKPFAKSMRSWLLDGDTSGLRGLMRGNEVEFRASNNTDMNIGTAADGGDLVPTGFYQQVIARRDQMSLPARLGCLRVPGVGTTVNVPFDNEADGEFVSTAETVAFDQDAPAVSKKALTLVKYTKKVTLSYELLEDEDARLMNFLMDFVARGQAKTLNSLLLTEVATNGTALKTFNSTTAIAAGEPEQIVFNNDLAAYLDDSGSVAWVTRASTYGAIASITGNSRLYAEQEAGAWRGPTLLGYPVYYSDKAAAPTAAAKTVYFGNWNYVGWREAPGFTMLRDPYSAAGTGQIVLHMYFRTVFGVLIAEAIGYGKQAAS